MKYMLIFGDTAERSEEWRSRPAEKQAEGYEAVGKWFAQHGSKVVHTDELQAPSSATTVKFVDGNPVVTDGPYIEAKETIGGYAVVDVPDLDTALDMAKTWPAQGMVEVRPIVPRQGES